MFPTLLPYSKVYLIFHKQVNWFVLTKSMLIECSTVLLMDYLVGNDSIHLEIQLH